MGPGTGLVCSITLNTALTPEQRERYQNQDVIPDILENVPNDRHGRPLGRPPEGQLLRGIVPQYEGYRIIPVNPRGGVILGERVYPDLLQHPGHVDLVDVFRPAPECPTIVDQAAAIGAGAVWTQLRIVNFAAADKALAAGLQVVMDRCVKMEHGRYNGSLHWAGMNTEIITSRKPRRLR